MKEVDKLSLPEEVKNNIQALLANQYDNANSLEDIANPDSPFVNSLEVLYDEALSDD